MDFYKSQYMRELEAITLGFNCDSDRQLQKIASYYGKSFETVENDLSDLFKIKYWENNSLENMKG